MVNEDTHSQATDEIGNGRATAILLARHGAKVALLDINVEWAKETKRMIDEEGGISEIIQTDVTDEESCRNAVAKTVELWGAVHILVNIGEQHMYPLLPVCCQSRLTGQVSGRRWCDGRCYNCKPGCLGQGLPHQRDQHGSDGSSHYSRDAKTRSWLNRQHVLSQWL